MGVSVCRVGILRVYLGVRLRKWDGWVGVWVFFCVRLDFVGAMSGRVIGKLGGKDREMGLL